MTLTLMAMQTLSGCFALMNFAADVFSRAGTHWSPNTLALFMGSLQLAGSFFTTMSIEKFGRKVSNAECAYTIRNVTYIPTYLGTRPLAQRPESSPKQENANLVDLAKVAIIQIKFVLWFNILFIILRMLKMQINK